MNAIDIINNILSNDNLSNYAFKYCLVSQDKVPFGIKNNVVKPNDIQDFCELCDIITCKNLNSYKGLGISIQGSNIWAIDVDHCFKEAFNLDSVDETGAFIINLFKNKAYIEFSFSGTGLRLLFKSINIDNYVEKYYIKNDKTHCEYYQPSNPARYVTITGRTIYNNNVNNLVIDELQTFLETFMLRPYKLSLNKNTDDISENRSLDDLLKLVKYAYLKDFLFQETWFNTTHKLDNKGQSLESNNDYFLCKYLYEHITKNKNMLKQIFESSPYFKTKDKKHIYKWEYNSNRYFNYIYDRL